MVDGRLVMCMNGWEVVKVLVYEMLVVYVRCRFIMNLENVIY